MARKPQQAKPEGTNREKIMSAFMALLAERRIEEISFGDVAASAGLSLAECRAEFGSLMAVLAAQVKETDRRVLAGGDADVAGEPPRERLFDVLMRRLEALAPHKAAIRSLMRSARRNPGLALALNPMAALDRELARGARFGALLDDVCGVASVLARLRPGRRWRRRDREEPRPSP